MRASFERTLPFALTLSKVPQSKNRWLGFILAVTGTLLFSLKSIFIKFLYHQGLNADQVLVLRMWLALPIYFGILMVTLGKRHTPALSFSVLWSVFLLGFIGYFLASLLDLMGLMWITAQLERLSLFTYPFMVAILGALFFRQSLSRHLMLALLITYSGLWIVMGQEVALTGHHVAKGVALVLGSALSFSFYVLISQRYIARLGSLVFTSLAMISSSIFSSLYGIVVLKSAWWPLSGMAWLWLVMLVIISTVIPSFMMTEAIHRIGPARTGVTGMLGPIFTLVLAVYLLHEPFNILIALGGMLVILGVTILLLEKHKSS